MKVVAEIQFIPIGTGVSLSPHVAEAVRLIRESGLPHHLHAMGTDVEGEWDEVLSLVRRCTDRLLAMGVPRLAVSVKLAVRADREGSMAQKVAAVERRLADGS